jgi:hypothetical protein
MDIYKFLKGLEPDDKGRFIYQIWNFTDIEIERTHDFIQRLFPLNEPSALSLNKFYIKDSALIERIRIDPTIAKNLIASKNFFLGFLSRNDQWQRHHNHNQLRITRIIKSLMLFVSRDEAESFFQDVISLIQSNASISTKAYEHWSQALGEKSASQAS